MTLLDRLARVYQHELVKVHIEGDREIITVGFFIRENSEPTGWYAVTINSGSFEDALEASLEEWDLYVNEDT